MAERIVRKKDPARRDARRDTRSEDAVPRTHKNDWAKILKSAVMDNLSMRAEGTSNRRQQPEYNLRLPKRQWMLLLGVPQHRYRLISDSFPED